MPHHETEIKLEVSNPRAVKRRLRELGFYPAVARHFETNILFDFPDLQLRKSQCLLRLRFVRRREVLTFKGPPQDARDYKVRREIEALLEDCGRMRQILECLGLRETFRYEKYRTVFAPQNKRREGGTPVLVYDETPIGNYLELEGPKRWIDKVARQLGYDRKDYIPASYGALYRQKCLERGEEPRDMVFSNRRSRHKS